MAALMNKAGMQGVISTDDLKELLECPVCFSYQTKNSI